MSRGKPQQPQALSEAKPAYAPTAWPSWIAKLDSRAKLINAVRSWENTALFDLTGLNDEGLRQLLSDLRAGAELDAYRDY